MLSMLAMFNARHTVLVTCLGNICCKVFASECTLMQQWCMTRRAYV